MKQFLLALTLLIATAGFAQVGVGTTTPDASAVLDVESTTKGFLPPRLTRSQILSISDPMIDRIKADIIEPISTEFWQSLRKDRILDTENLKLIHKAWLVEYQEGTYQNLHVHKTSLFTSIWTIYCDPQEPKAAQLHLHNPITESWTLGFFQETIKIDPAQDTIYVFPAWIAHNVTPCTARRVVFVWDTIAVPA
jgi:hypothetical protein